MKGWGGVEWVGGRKRERERAERAKAGVTDEQRKRKKKTRGTSPESGRRDTDEREKRRVNQSKVV